MESYRISGEKADDQSEESPGSSVQSPEAERDLVKRPPR
jgi:hypothetical protein